MKPGSKCALLGLAAAMVLLAGPGRLAAFTAGSDPLEAGTDPLEECLSDDNQRRIRGCSGVIESGGHPRSEVAQAYAMRALAFSLQGQYDRALSDYDNALMRNPDSAVTLNNRAWALHKSGKGPTGLADVERSLRLSPMSSHAHDTRAHIRQTMGNLSGALSDYKLAMRYGGEAMVKLYQCGLQANGLYSGDIDGRASERLIQALESCVKSSACDPLPADEECRKVTS